MTVRGVFGPRDELPDELKQAMKDGEVLSVYIDVDDRFKEELQTDMLMLEGITRILVALKLKNKLMITKGSIDNIPVVILGVNTGEVVETSTGTKESSEFLCMLISEETKAKIRFCDGTLAFNDTPATKQ